VGIARAIAYGANLSGGTTGTTGKRGKIYTDRGISPPPRR